MAANAPSARAVDPRTPGPVYRRYVLSMCTLVCAVNVTDRALMILLLQPIKADLHLTDSELGFLTGIAFGLFYATLGIPIGRWADRGNRVTIVSAALALWSLTVMASAAVTRFSQLVLARIAAGVGEAGGMPPTYSLIGDVFPGAVERTRAMSVYMMSDPVALLVSFIAGGWLNQHYGWRAAFLVMGLPALAVAVLFKATVHEPRTTHPSSSRSSSHPPFRTVLFTLWRQPSSRHLAIGLILVFLLGVGLSPWYAAFMTRSHGVDTQTLGIWLGLIYGIGGIAGVLIGGYASTRWFGTNPAAQIRLSALMTAAMAPAIALVLLLPNTTLALLALVPLTLTGNFIFGPTFALLQRLVAPEMRATALAVVMLLANLIGMGLGPQAVGWLSDRLQPAFATNSLRYAMLAMSIVAFWAAFHLWRVGRTVETDLYAVSTTHDIKANAFS